MLFFLAWSAGAALFKYKEESFYQGHYCRHHRIRSKNSRWVCVLIEFEWLDGLKTYRRGEGMVSLE